MEIVKLQVYRGKVTRNENGEIDSENQPTKIARPSKEWNLFLQHAPVMYTKVEIIQVTQEIITHGEKTLHGKIIPTQTHDYKLVETSEEIKAEVAGIFKTKVVQTPEQKQIAELTKRLNDLSGVEPANIEDVKIATNSTNSDLEALRQKYFDLYQEKPSHLMKEKGLKAAIEAKQNEVK